MTAGSPESPMESDARSAWWSEWEAWLIFGAALTFLVGNLGRLPLKGEEPRRGLIAREMIQSGDWVVPTTQGKARLSRPPLQNWLIAITSFARGELDWFAIRFPSAVATALSLLGLYACSRRIMSRGGAVVATVSLGTMAQVLELGGLGETEAIFMLFVAGSLLIWITNWNERPLVAWVGGYGCMSLALLTKGLQAPIYFLTPLLLFLIWKRELKQLTTWSHWAGLLVAICPIAIWQGLFFQRAGLDASIDIYWSNVTSRFVEDHDDQFWKHLAIFPIQVLAVTLPWGPIALSWVSVRDGLNRRQRDVAVFLTLAIVVAFITVWLPAAGRARYLMPIFPALAMLGGLSVQEWLRRQSGYANAWKNYQRTLLAVVTTLAIVHASISTVFPDGKYSVEPIGATVWLVIILIATGIGNRLVEWDKGILWVGVSLGLFYAGPVLGSLQKRSFNPQPLVTSVKRGLPPDARLVSFGWIQHAFLFPYRDHVPQLPWPKQAGEVPRDVDYFCINVFGDASPRLPFDWEEVAVIPCDRFIKPNPTERVILGRIRRDAQAERPQTDGPVRR